MENQIFLKWPEKVEFLGNLPGKIEIFLLGSAPPRFQTRLTLLPRQINKF